MLSSDRGFHGLGQVQTASNVEGIIDRVESQTILGDSVFQLPINNLCQASK